LVLLHSNDMHGDFFAEDAEGLRVGGVSLRSGYVQQVRREHRNTSFAVAGDMVQGSVIDAGFRGLSTINLMLRHRSAVPGIADCYRLSVAFSVTT
jgi:5'-nucleotidase